MRLYVDSSALIKRAIEEPESDYLERMLGQHVADEHLLVSSTLTWIEVSRAIRARLAQRQHEDHESYEAMEAMEIALSGVAQRPIGRDVVGLSRRIGPPILRTLDAIHLATAVLVDADVMVTYDDRLAEACRQNGVAVSMPGR